VTPLPDGTNHAGDSLQGGADRKWDNSRKIRKKFLNPAGISLAAIGGNPSFNSTFPNYPSTADGDGHPGGAGALDAPDARLTGFGFRERHDSGWRPTAGQERQHI
jgi:hypothetical protein